MPSLDQHIADCIEELGEGYRDVHIWLDEYFEVMGPKHRVMRHHAEGIEEARKKFGDQGAKAAEIHIKADCNGRIPKKAELQLSSLFTWGKM